MSKITRNDLQKVLKKYHKKNTEIIKDMNDKIKTNSNFIDENKAKIESMEENLDINSQLVDVEIKGRTLVNLLGRYGNAIYKQFDTNHKYGKLTYEGDSYVIESEQLENGWITTLDTDITFTKDKYYICLGEVYVESGNRGNVNITSKTTNIKHQYREATETGKWVNCWEASQCGDVADGFSKVYFAAVSFGTSSKTKFRNMRVYELTKEQYDSLDGKERDEVAELYPYVDDIKHVVNPYLESKENLLGDDYWVEGAIYPDGTVNTSADTGNIVNISANIFTKKDDVYTLHIKDLDTAIYKPILWNMGGTQGAVIGTDTDTIKITCEHDGILKCGIRRVDGVKDDTNMKVLSDLLNNRVLKPCIVKGDTAKSYDECNNSRIMFETKLYEGETISRRNDGIYVKNSEWEEIEINELLGRQIFGVVGNSGYHTVCIDAKDIYDNALIAKLASYNGNIIINRKSSVADHEHFYIDYSNHTDRHIVIILPNALTGWGGNYTPTQEEIKAFFLGWRIYARTLSPETSFDRDLWDDNLNGTHKKNWVKLWGGIGTKYTDFFTVPIVYSSNVAICTTVMNDQGYTPYRLIYKKETPTIEEVKTYGGLVVKDGVDITSGSGLVLGEMKEQLFSNANGFYINPMGDTIGYYASQACDNRVNDILKCIQVKDGELLNFVSGLAITTYGEINHGKKYATIKKDKITFPVSYDYLIYKPDTVTSYDYNISSDSLFKNVVNKLNDEVIATKEELIKTKKELEHTRYVLSQRSNPNLLINGDFKVWQRGTLMGGTSNDNIYLADRWFCFTNQGPDAGIFKKVDKGILVKGRIGQYLEYDKNIAGQTVTLSIKADDVNDGINIYSADNGNYKWISSISRNGIHSVTFKFPEGKNGVGILIQSIKDNEFTIEWVKLELGECATPFVPKTYAEELRDCQRYYQTLTPSQIIMSTSTNEFVSTYIPLQGLMRQSGTVILPTESNVLYVKEINENVGEIYPIITTATASHQIYIKAAGSFDSTKIYKLCITKTIGVDAEIY